MRSVYCEKPAAVEVRLRTSGWRQVWVWLPVLGMLAVIATESTDTFSASHTSGWLRPLFERMLGRLTEARWEQIHHLLRKTGHFCGYGAVCLSFLRAWLLELGRIVDLGSRSWRLRSCILAVASTAAVAGLDEWHQTFIPSRTGTAHDAALDTLGGIFSCGLVWLFFWQKRTDRQSW